MSEFYLDPPTDVEFGRRYVVIKGIQPGIYYDWYVYDYNIVYRYTDNALLPGANSSNRCSGFHSLMGRRCARPRLRGSTTSQSAALATFALSCALTHRRPSSQGLRCCRTRFHPTCQSSLSSVARCPEYTMGGM